MNSRRNIIHDIIGDFFTNKMFYDLNDNVTPRVDAIASIKLWDNVLTQVKIQCGDEIKYQIYNEKNRQ